MEKKMQSALEAALVHVLLVEPNPSDAATIEGFLAESVRGRFQVAGAKTFSAGLTQADGSDVVVLSMPVLDAETLPRISRLLRQAPGVAIVVIVGHADELPMLEALRLGAEDVVLRSELDGPSLRRRLRFAIIRKHEERLLRILNAAPGEVGEAQAGQAEDDMPAGVPQARLDLRGVIGSACLLLQGQATASRVRILVDLADDLPMMRGNRDRLQQAIVNLMTTAIKRTPPGGRITVGAGRNGSGELSISVSDSGTGMHRGAAAEIGEPSASTGGAPASARDERGLGLALTAHFVRMHGGCIDVENRPGSGTVVAMRFPADRLTAASGPAAASARPAVTATTARD